MVNQVETIERLGREKEYEDELEQKLHTHFLAILDKISDITAEEKNKLHETLGFILAESHQHSNTFGELLQMVFDNGDREY
jgi:hypothetical protein